MKTIDLYLDTSLTLQNISDYAISHHGVTVLRQNIRTTNILGHAFADNTEVPKQKTGRVYTIQI